MRKLQLIGVAAAAALFATAPAAADTVADWWDYAGRIASPLTATPQTPDQARAVTRASLAMFEAVNAIDRRSQRFLNFPAGDPAASQDAAAATAAYTVMLAAYPNRKAALDDSYAITMAEIKDEKAREAGRQI